MHSKHCLVQLAKQSRHDLHHRADLYRRLADAVSDGDMSDRLSALADRYRAEAEAHKEDE